jgi:hypothetical protein
MSDYIIQIQRSTIALGSIFFNTYFPGDGIRSVYCSLCADTSINGIRIFYAIYGEIQDNLAAGYPLQLAETPFPHMTFSMLHKYQSFLREQYEVA